MKKVRNSDFLEEMSSIQKSLFLLGEDSISITKENYELFIKTLELNEALEEIFLEDIFEKQEDLSPFADDPDLLNLISKIIQKHFGNLVETNYFDSEKIYFYSFIQILIQSKSEIAKKTFDVLIQKIQANPKLKNSDDWDDLLYFFSLILGLGKSISVFKESYKEVMKILENRNSSFSSYLFLKNLMGDKVDFTKHYGYSIFFTNERTKISKELLFSTTSYRILSIKEEKGNWEYLNWDSKAVDDYSEFEPCKLRKALPERS